MVLVVNGPITRRLQINSGNNALGQGHRPNATIGRAVRLVMMNVMNTTAGFSIGHARQSRQVRLLLRRERARSSVEPLHARAASARRRAVTVYASNSLYQVYNQLAARPEPLLLCFADALGHVGSPNLRGFNETLVILAGEHTEILRASGWSRRDVQQFLIEHTRRRVADIKRAARLPGAITEATRPPGATCSRSRRTSCSCALAAAPAAGPPASRLGHQVDRAVTERIEAP
jgi:hypothetical protein